MENQISKITHHPLVKIMLLLVVFLCSIQVVSSQNKADLSLIKSIYERLENDNTSSQELLMLTSSIQWETTKTGDRNTITLYAIVKNQWRGVDFENLQFKEMEKNKILVTGSVMGKQPTECEPVNTDFQHIWTVKDGQILHLNE